MPRRKTLSDEDALDAALRLMHAHGPDALTFERIANECGLSAATLVQRFGSKAELKKGALHRAWDLLDEKTRRLAAETPNTTDGAVQLLVALSRDYGGIEDYAEGLLVLREDLRDPTLRARGAAWKAALFVALDECLRDIPGEDLGQLMAAQWQGSLLWWSFEPKGKVEDFVETGLRRFVEALRVSPIKTL
jgi:AcrR family transcriptional regulator